LKYVLGMRASKGLFISTAFLFACNPYQRRGTQYDVEPVDPIKFPMAYLGDGGDPKQGGGVFTAFAATVSGAAVEYYSFPFVKAQLAAKDPLALGDVSTPLVYVFDASNGSLDTNTARCVPPADYAYNPQTDAIHYDEQNDVFTVLPAGASYVPLVAEVPVTSNGEGCQTIRGADSLVTSKQVQVPLKPPAVMTPTSKPSGVPDGKLLARAVIDPGAEVRHSDGKRETINNLGPQRIGWYNNYFVQYIDGGYVGTTPTADGSGVDLQTQVLYVPATVPTVDDKGNPATKSTHGAPGSGFDVLQAKRGDANYSPICHVQVFTPVDGSPLPTSEADIPTATLTEAPTPYIFCLQTK
jgi:hypothetical protein